MKIIFKDDTVAVYSKALDVWVQENWIWVMKPEYRINWRGKKYVSKRTFIKQINRDVVKEVLYEEV